jgi:SAM-dependent methyltransferase
MSHPRQLVARAHNFAIAAAERSLGGDARVCPCCGWRGLRFRSFAVVEDLRTGVICPGCGSFERHRALASFYPRLFADLGLRPALLIHCAPERSLRKTFAALCDRYETSAYGETTPADHRFDLTAIDRPDASCDAFVLHHVLDCMEGDRLAVAEMHRVLRPGGIVLAIVTLKIGDDTREVPLASNSLRRVYGTRDLATRMAPFDTSVHDAAAGLSAAERRTFGIPRSVPVLVLRKATGVEQR